MYRGGSLVESYGLDRDPEPVTAADRQEYVDLITGGVREGQGRRDHLAALDDPNVPTVLPAYRSLVVDDEGGVWAERWAYGTFDVFGPDRALLGRVVVPLALTQIVGDLLVGVWRDDFDVEHVRVYRFRRIADHGGP